MRGGILWSTVAFAGTRVVTLLSTLVLARILVPGEFGLVAAALVYLTLIELASDLGLKATVVFEQEDGITRRVQTALTVNLLLALLLTVLGVALAPLIAGFFRVPDEVDLFRLAALNPLLAGAGNMHDALLLRDLEFRRRVISQGTRSIARAAVGIALALAGLGAQALVLGFLAGTVVWVVTLWHLVPLRPSFALDRDAIRAMAAYGGGASLLEVLAVIGSRADAVVIGRSLGESALGLYTIAFRVPELVIESVSANVSTVAFPALSRKRRSDPAQLQAATLKLLRYSAIYALTASALIAVSAPALTVVLFSDRWASTAPVLSAIAIMCAFVAITFPLGDVFKALGRQRLLVAVNLVGIPLLLGALIGAVMLGAGIVTVAWVRAGVGAAQCVAIIVMVVLTLSIPARALWGAIGPGLATGAAAAVGTGAVRLTWPGPGPLELLVQLGAGAGAAALVLGVVGPEITRGTIGRIAALRRPRSPEAPRGAEALESGQGRAGITTARGGLPHDALPHDAPPHDAPPHDPPPHDERRPAPSASARSSR